MRVKFLRDALYENDGRNAGHTFKAGEVYDFEQDFADRWIRRGAAEAIGDDGKAVEPASRFVPVGAADKPTDAEGGSQKLPEDDAELEKLRADYEELFGKKPHHASKAETLRNAINEELAK